MPAPLSPDAYLAAFARTRRPLLDVAEPLRAASAGIGTRTVVFGGGWPAGLALPPGDEALPAVLVGQMRGLAAAHRHGLNVANPAADRGLYSRTMRGVRINDAA